VQLKSNLKSSYPPSLLKKLLSFNANQIEAITTSDGFILIIAGPGSGKTMVITHRIAHLIIEKKIPPEQILGLTFTNKSAGDMQERLATLLNEDSAHRVMLSTFHSFCMYVLRREIESLGYTKEFSLYSERDTLRLLKNLAKYYLQLDDTTPIEKDLAKILQAKQLGTRAKEFSYHNVQIQELFHHLELSMCAYNAVDFDTLLSLTVELFERFPAILNTYQEKFRYIMIDEYQDTNSIQDKLSHLLAKKYGNLCVVGDDDQSIYSWRGANIQNILQFPYCKLITLEQNYRSTPTILEAANNIIANNIHRYKKWLCSQKKMGDPIHIFHAATEIEESTTIIDRILHLKEEKKLQWKEIAILYRSNILSKPFELALLGSLWKSENGWKRGIPYEIIGGTELYERTEIKDLVAYLRVIINPFDQEALLRIINYPRRGISAKTLDLLTRVNRCQKQPLWTILLQAKEGTLDCVLTSSAKKGIYQLLSLLEETKKIIEVKGVHLAIRHLLTAIDLKKHILEESKTQKIQEYKWENVEQFLLMLQDFEENEEENSLSHFLQSLALEKNFKRKKGLQNNSIKLLTFHSSKGLEFPACFLVALEDHLVPHEKSLIETSLEEERRLFYVALTRAKHYLTLSMSRTRNKRGKEVKTTPSRFLYEIPKELLCLTKAKTLTPFQW